LLLGFSSSTHGFNAIQIESRSISKSRLNSVNRNLLNNLDESFQYEGRLPSASSDFRCGFVSIIGAPNMGKSTLMNALLNKRIAKVGDEPAITKQQQRHQINDHMILVDTPGMMWPKIEHESDGYLLAASNIIGKNAYFEEEVGEILLTILLSAYPELLTARYKIENAPHDAIQYLELLTEKKGFPLKNKRKDLERAAITLINDYRQDLIGKISLESPLSREQMIKEKKSN
jgi:ribosome biogenesis GTPase A